MSRPVARIVDRILEHAAERPDREALAWSSGSVSYGELAERIGSAMGVLQQRGVRAGDRVILGAVSTGPGFVYGYFACHRLGAIAVPVEPRIGSATLGGIIEQTEPKQVCLDPGIFEASAGGPAEQASADPDAAADLLFTGGTTGRPKGVIQTHRNILAFAGGRNKAVGASSDDRLALPLPLSHGFALGRLRASALCGATVILIDGLWSPDGFFQEMVRRSANALCCVPAGFAVLFRVTGDRLGELRNQLSYLETATAPLPQDQQERLRRLLPRSRLYNSYGMTETTSSIAFIDLNQRPEKAGSVGRIIPGLEVRVDDGQLQFRGDNVMKGYWRDPIKTAEVLQDGWYTANDVGELDSDGFLFLKGRREELINVGGLKVAPAEVENLLSQHPDIGDSACIGIPDPRGLSGEAVEAYVVQASKSARRPTPEDLVEFLRGRIEAYKIPSRFIWVAAIPRTNLGKLQRARLKELDHV
jgi:long-chain acyl-CoA synthetase